MDGVGSKQGYVHEQRQGTGLATVLSGGDFAAKTYIATADAAAKAKEAARAAKAKEAEDALKGMRDYIPEFWYADDAELKGDLERFHDQGAGMLAGGINPWTSLDPRAHQWRKESARLKQKAQYSKQRKEYYDKSRATIEGKPPGYYTDESTADVLNWPKKMDLNQMIANPDEPPMLVQRTPAINLMTEWNGLMEAEKTRVGRELDYTEMQSFARRALADPATGQKLMEGYNSQLAQMDPGQKKNLEGVAAASGKTVYQIMAEKDAEWSMKKDVPIDMNATLEGFAGKIDPSVITWEKGGKGGASVNKKMLAEEAASLVKNYFDNPYKIGKTLAQMETSGLVPRDPKDTDAEYQKKVEAYMTAEVEKRVQKNVTSKISEKEAGKQKLEETGKIWLEHLYSTNAALSKEAASHLMQMKLFGNMYVEESSITTVETPQGKQRALRLRFKGAPKLYKEGEDQKAGPSGSFVQAKTTAEQAKQAAEDAGIPTENLKFTQAGTEDQLDLILDKDTEARFMALYMEFGNVYEGAGNYQDNVRDVSMPQNAPPTPGTNPANPSKITIRNK